VNHVAVAAFAAVHAGSVTSELTAPALQRGEPDAQKHRQLMGTGAISNAFIEDL
jgi:hypothetical protein